VADVERVGIDLRLEGDLAAMAVSVDLHSFPTDLLKMGEVQGNRHFQISKAISADMKAGPAG
jgi:hypothetical protein